MRSNTYLVTQMEKRDLTIRSENASLLHALAVAALLILPLTTGYARAHVVLEEPVAAPGAHYTANFRVGHGCSGSPTVALRVAIPPGIGMVKPQEVPGWTFSTEKDGGRISAVAWKGGELASDKPGTFTITMMLPDKEGPLLFPATQTCKVGEAHWSDARPESAKLSHPAPRLMVMAGGTAAPAPVVISGGWFRALPPSVPSGGYFTLRNTGGKTVILTGLSSPACGMLMMHKSENGGMTHVMSLDVAAGETVSFAPGGYHLMCMDSKPMLKPGAQVPVTLQFQDGGSATAKFSVRNAMGK